MYLLCKKWFYFGAVKKGVGGTLLSFWKAMILKVDGSGTNLIKCWCHVPERKIRYILKSNNSRKQPTTEKWKTATTVMRHSERRGCQRSIILYSFVCWRKLNTMCYPCTALHYVFPLKICLSGRSMHYINYRFLELGSSYKHGNIPEAVMAAQWSAPYSIFSSL